VDKFFDRLGDLLKSILQEDELRTGGSSNHRDPDMKDAWEELEDYLRTGADESTAGRGAGSTGYRTSTGRRTGPPDELRKDYANLEVSFGADFQEVRKSYRRLLRAYHPDRHAGDPQKLRTATEITQRITQSFQRIKQYHETGSV
jgi:DnaJ-domain-containing protein 1